MAHYADQQITCYTPEILSQNLQYNIDISLNGQQFTNKPHLIKFYDASVHSLRP